MSNASKKGKDFEDYVTDQIIEKGLDLKARRSAGSGNGNRDKGDIVTSLMVLGQNAGIECKNQKNIHIEEWWRQTKKLESLRMEPVLAFHILNEPWEETKVVIYLDSFLELVKLANSEKIYEEVTPEDSREKKWAIQNMISSLKKLEKFYE